MDDRLVLVGHLATTTAMVGLIWTVQLVVYPQFTIVSSPNDKDSTFNAYIGAHSKRMIYVLALFAPAEIILALLLWVQQPFGISGPLAFLGGILLVAGWTSTAFWFAPLHGRLSHGYDQVLIDQLLVTNWVRTALWSIRGVLAFYLTVPALGS